MKNIIFMLLILIMLQSCNDGIDSKLLDFAREIIEQPDKILDLQKYYPDFYKEEYIDLNTLKDSSDLKSLINDINNDFKHKDISERITLHHHTQKSIEQSIKIKMENVNTNDFVGFSIWRGKTGIGFLFIKEEDWYNKTVKYYICQIHFWIAKTM